MGLRTGFFYCREDPSGQPDGNARRLHDRRRASTARRGLNHRGAESGDDVACRSRQVDRVVAAPLAWARSRP
jgi:hypothetical protein